MFSPKSTPPRMFGLSLICLLGVVGATGCEQFKISGETVAQAPPADNDSHASKLLTDWVNPRAVLVISGDEHGYMEPCGCTGGQLGGFAKRAELFRQLTEDKHWPTVGFSLGGSLNENRISYPQTPIKLSAMRRGLNGMGYKGAVIGREELELQPDELFNQHAATANLKGFDLPFLSANVTLFGTKEADMPPRDLRVLELGGLKIGVAAVTGASAKKNLTLEDGLLTFVPPEEVLPAVIQKLTAEKPDVLVLLAHADLAEAKELIAKFPQFHVVAIADPLALGSATVGQTLIVPLGGEKGNQVSVVGLFGSQPGRFTFKGEQIELRESQFPDHPSMTEIMRAYQDDLKAHWIELNAFTVSDPSQGKFVGVDQCKACHQAAYDVWVSSGHAERSYPSLIEGRPDSKGEWVPRIYDPECLCCHTTGWQPQTALRYSSGFVDVETTPQLNNQQCENCHGPGSKHVELEQQWTTGAIVSPELQSARDGMRLTLERAKRETCARCHDGDNSPHFDFDTWWPNIEH